MQKHIFDVLGYTEMAESLNMPLINLHSGEEADLLCSVPMMKTHTLATDMVGSLLMGFELSDIPAIVLAHQTGMLPATLEDIEIHGSGIDECKRRFVKPDVYKWTDINAFWGAKEI